MPEEKGLKFVGIDPDGKAKPCSLEQDNDGKFVLRVVDAAPFAYDELKGEFKVNVKNEMSEPVPTMRTGKISDTIDLGSVEVEPGETEQLGHNIDISDCPGIYIVWHSSQPRNDFSIYARQRLRDTDHSSRLDPSAKHVLSASSASETIGGSTEILTFAGGEIELYIKNEGGETFNFEGFTLVKTSREGMFVPASKSVEEAQNINSRWYNGE